MLQPKTVAALAFLLAAGAAAYWQLSRDDERAEVEAPPSPLPRFAAADVDELVIDDAVAQRRVALEKDGETWRLVEPLADAADAANVTAALNQLAAARVNPRAVTTSRESWAKLKIGEDQALTVALRRAGAEVATLHLSADAGYLRAGTEPAVYSVKGINRAMLAREPRMWRDRVVTAFDAERVAAISVTDASGARAAARRIAAASEAGRDTWELTEGAAIVGSFDANEPVGIVGRMQRLVAEDFADDRTLASAGLATPRVRVEVTLEDGRAQTLLVGDDADAKTVYVGRADSDRVWTAAKPTIDGFAKPPLQWRDKTLAALPAADVTRIDLRHGAERITAVRDGGSWKLERPAGTTPNGPRLDTLAAALQTARGVAIATDTSAATTGLRAPTAEATYTARDGRRVTITIGAKAGDKWHVRASGRDDVLLVADYLVRKLLVTVADVRAKD